MASVGVVSAFVIACAVMLPLLLHRGRSILRGASEISKAIVNRQEQETQEEQLETRNMKRKKTKKKAQMTTHRETTRCKKMGHLPLRSAEIIDDEDVDLER